MQQQQNAQDHFQDLGSRAHDHLKDLECGESLVNQGPTSSSSHHSLYSKWHAVALANKWGPTTSRTNPQSQRSVLWSLAQPCLLASSACGMFVDFVDTSAIQCIGLVLFPLVGALGYLSGHYEGWLGSNVTASQPPSPPANPDIGRLVAASAFDLATDYPLMFLALDLGGAVAFGLLVLFWKDMQDWLQQRYGLLSHTYIPLGSEKANDPGEPASSPPPQLNMYRRKSSISAAEDQMRRLIHSIEELEIKLRVSPDDADLQARLRELTDMLMERRSDITHGSGLEHAVTDVAGLGNEDDEGEASCFTRFARSNFMVVLQRSTNGLIAIALYFADLISDVSVMLLLIEAGDVIWASEAAVLLFAQFVAVYFRVLPYLRTTFGRTDWHYLTFLLLGLPAGLIALDLLMFLEPFGLLVMLVRIWPIKLPPFVTPLPISYRVSVSAAATSLAQDVSPSIQIDTHYR